MMLIPVTGPDGQVIRINPAFNLRFFFPRLVSLALNGLHVDHWEDWYASYLEEHGVTEKQLLDCWQAYSRYAQSCLASVDQKGPVDALQVSGFLDHPQEARLVVLAKMGQLLTASLWLPLRDGTHLGEQPEDIYRLAEQSAQLQLLLLSGSGE